MKKNTAFSLLIILSVAALFRFSFLDKPEGLWNDEYTSWYISSLSDWQIFFAKVFQNCHTPLYYLYLKLWMLLFNDNDLTLRLSSVIPSLLSIPVMYFAGKEIKDKNTGLFAAGFTAISSFCIYFAQEARLYSLLFLISSLTVLYFIKATKEANKINIFFFFLFQSLLCALHTLGIVYIFFMTGFYILYGKKEGIDLKKYLPALCILVCALMILSPLLFKIAFSKTLYQFWSSFSLSKVFFNFTDYFSPVQMNIINTPKSIIKTFINNGHLNLKFIIFAVIPSIIALIGICRGLKEKNNYLNILTAISGLFYLCAVLFSLSGKMILVTKYTSEIYPSLILTFSLGILSIKKAPLKKLLISVFVFIHLFYLILAPDAAYKQERNEGHKIVADLIKESDLTEGDFLLFTYYDKDKFEKYVNTDIYTVKSFNKYNFNYFMYENPDYFYVIKNIKKQYKKSFSEFPDEKITHYVNHFLIYKMLPGQKIGIVFLNSVSFYSREELKEITEDEKKYKRTPFIFLVFSAFRANILYLLENAGYKKVDEKQKGAWSLYVFEKE